MRPVKPQWLDTLSQQAHGQLFSLSPSVSFGMNLVKLR